MARAGRKGAYLYQRPNSKNWWIKLQRPDGTVERKSLGTDVREDAEVKAAPLIHEHKYELLCHAAAKKMEVHPLSWGAVTTAMVKHETGPEYPPGRHDLSGGGYVVAQWIDKIGC